MKEETDHFLVAAHKGAAVSSSEAAAARDSEVNAIALELDEAAQQKLEVIESLMEPCDRATYGEKLRDAAETLGCSVRRI